MSQENVEIVRGFLPAPDVNIVPLVRDDEMWPALVDASHISFAHADYESVLKGLPDGDKTYVGADGERALWLDWLAPWVSYRVGAEEYVDLGERVLVRSYAFGRSEASTAEVKLTHGDIWTIRDGKLARVEYYTSRAEALKAAGLEE
jgi:ketosteroid isomerase-like protein